MKKQTRTLRLNCSLARRAWGDLDRTTLSGLRELSVAFGLSVALGDVQLIDGRWYVTHAGLLRLALRRRCHGITSSLQKDLSNATSSQWVFKATVYKTSHSKGFVGYGDADPSNTSPLVREGSQPRTTQGVRNRTLLGRRVGIILRDI